MGITITRVCPAQHDLVQDTLDQVVTYWVLGQALEAAVEAVASVVQDWGMGWV